MHLIKFEYTNPKCETNTNDRNQKFQTSGLIVFDHSGAVFSI
jgi:hypothetical protein